MSTVFRPSRTRFRPRSTILALVLIILAGFSLTNLRSAEAATVKYDYKYVVVYLSPKSKGVPSGAQVNHMATTFFDKYFPFSTNCRGTIKVGNRCVLRFLGSDSPVRVEAVGYAYFELVSLPGHAEGPNRHIKFWFENKYDRIYMYVSAWGEGQWKTRLTKWMFIAKDIWTTYAQRLGNGVLAGDWKYGGGGGTCTFAPGAAAEDAEQPPGEFENLPEEPPADPTPYDPGPPTKPGDPARC